MAICTISKNGTIILSKEILFELGVKPGEDLTLELQSDCINVIPGPDARTRMQQGFKDQLNQNPDYREGVAIMKTIDKSYESDGATVTPTSH